MKAISNQVTQSINNTPNSSISSLPTLYGVIPFYWQSFQLILSHPLLLSSSAASSECCLPALPKSKLIISQLMKAQLLLLQLSFNGSLSLSGQGGVEKVSITNENYEKYGIYKDFLKEKKSSSASLFLSSFKNNISMSQKEERNQKLISMIDQEYNEIKKSYSSIVVPFVGNHINASMENSQNQICWNSIQIYHSYIMVSIAMTLFFFRFFVTAMPCL
jgi:hypothetical protein